MSFSKMLLVRQNFPDRRIADIPGTVRHELHQAPFAGRLKPGARVAIGVGSRGIANIATIVRTVVDYWKDAGMQPFLFPAMGSHGAATAEGQADVLAHYGIHEAGMGCPVISSIEVVPLGRTPEGIETFMDRNAFESDGVMLVGRVKWHTDFSGKIESGLYKMMAIGLGKFAGAQRYHTHAYRMGLEQVIRSVGRQVLTSGKILGGLAILEDANHNTAKLEAVPVENMERREEELQALAKSWMGRIPVRQLDILIVDEIGKNISGAGMDTKVINRSIQCHYNPWPELAAHRADLRAGLERADLQQRGGAGDGRRGHRSPGGAHRLATHAHQLADGFDALGDPDSDSFRDGPRVSGENRAHRGPVRPGGGHDRLDPEHDGARHDRVQRKPVAGTETESGTGKSGRAACTGVRPGR